MDNPSVVHDSEEIEGKVEPAETSVTDYLYNLVPNDCSCANRFKFRKYPAPEGHDFALACRLEYYRKFKGPPASMKEEFEREVLQNKHAKLMSLHHSCTGKTLGNSPPIIGILTQPVSENKKDAFDHHEYILEVNDKFIKWAGTRTVAIPFDVSEKELYFILSQINGVLFTGGALDLIDAESGKYHPYYATAKRVFDYSK